MYQYFSSMMGWGGMSFLMFFTWLVWTTVGILLIIKLWQQISGK